MIRFYAIVDSKVLLEELRLFSDALSQSEAPWHARVLMMPNSGILLM